MPIGNIVTLVAAGLAFIASLIAAVVSIYNARFRRFALEKWWERKAEVYAEVVGSLVAMTYSLDRWVRHESRQHLDEEYTPSPDVQKAIRDEYAEARTRIERIAVEGNYVISEKAADALAGLVKQLRRGPGRSVVTWADWMDCLEEVFKAASACLETIRDEAREDLCVK